MILQTNTAILRDIVQYAVEHPEQTATFVAAIIGAFANYQKTGKFPIGRLPFRALRDAWAEYSDRYFGKARPKGVPALVVDTDQDTFESTLRPRHFESADLMSYEYEDEVLNLRRPRGKMSSPSSGDDVPMETHVRTFTLDDGRILALVHDEANRYETTDEHLSPGLYSWERGRDILSDDLDDADIQYQTVESERAADVVVQPN